MKRNDKLDQSIVNKYQETLDKESVCMTCCVVPRVPGLGLSRDHVCVPGCLEVLVPGQELGGPAPCTSDC